MIGRKMLLGRLRFPLRFEIANGGNAILAIEHSQQAFDRNQVL